MANVRYMFSASAWIDAFEIFREHNRHAELDIKSNSNMIQVYLSWDGMTTSEINKLKSLGWRYSTVNKYFYRYM